MADKSLQVTISAEVTSLQAKTAVAKAEMNAFAGVVRTTAKNVATASGEMKEALTATLTAQVEQLQKLENNYKELGAQTNKLSQEAAEAKTGFAVLSSGITELGEKAEAARAKFAVFSGAFAAVSELALAGLGLEQVFEGIKSTAEVGESIGQLAEKTGISTEAISGLRVVARETNVDMDMLSNGLRNLSKNIQEGIANPTSNAARQFKQLGVSLVDANGQALPLDDVLQQVATHLGSFADGAAKSADAGYLFGSKVGANLIPLLNQLSAETLPGAAQRAKDLGVSFDDAAVQADEHFLQSMHDAGFSLEGLRDTTSNAVIPALTVLEESFTSTASGTSTLTATAEVLATALKGIVEAGTVVVTEVGIITTAAAGLGEELGDVITAAGALGLALRGDFKDAESAMSAAASGMQRDWTATFSKIHQEEQTLADTHNALWNNYAAPPPLPAKAPPTAQAPNLSAPGSASGPDVLAQDQATLAQQNAQIEATATSTKQANQEKLQNTVQYWEGVLAAGNLSSKQELQVQTDLAKAETALKSQQLSGASSAVKSAESEQTQITKDAAEARKQIARSEYETKVQFWDSEVTSGKMSKAQEVQDEIAAQQQMYAAALAEAEKEAALDTAGTAAKAKALDDIAVMQAQHVELMAQLNNQLVQAQTEAANKAAEVQAAAAEKTTQAWQKAFAPINQAFDSSINGVIQGTQTLQNAEAKAAQSIALAFIDAEAKKVLAFAEGEAQIAVTALASQLKITAAVQAGQAVQTATKAAGSAEGKSIDAATSSATIVNNAHTAFTGAFSAVAGIPYVGPVLAPVAGAAAFAAVMAMDVLSAAGGLQVGAGEEPLVQLHENETVLPAHIAMPFQAMMARGNVNNNSTGDTSVTNHFNLTASGGSGGSTADQILSTVNDALRSGRLQQYPAIARMMRR